VVEARVEALLREAGPLADTSVVEDVCGDIWLHLAELAAEFPGLAGDELEGQLPVVVEVLVDRHRHDTAHQVPAGRMAEVPVVGRAADTAGLAVDLVDAAGYRPVPRPIRPATTSWAFDSLLRPLSLAR
jgi:hypothetical protein